MLRAFTSKLVANMAAVAFLAGPAMASKLISLNGTAPVAIWIDGQSMKDADRLINAGVAAREPNRIAQYLSCVAASGTEVDVTDAHLNSGYFDVIVTSGPYARRCAGVVKMDNVE